MVLPLPPLSLIPLRKPVTRQFFTVAPVAPSTSTPYLAGDSPLPVRVWPAQSSTAPERTRRPVAEHAPTSAPRVAARRTVSPHRHAMAPPQSAADAAAGASATARRIAGTSGRSRRRRDGESTMSILQVPRAAGRRGGASGVD